MRRAERVCGDMWDLQSVSSDLHTRNNIHTKLAKSAIIVGAFDLPLFWVSVQALVTSRAVSIFREPPTLRHAPEVVLVEKLTSISFLTKASEPMLTYGGKPLPVSRMSW
jgi:hypothetical protein